ncbi:hypothetical protein ACFPH6_32370 [Streptomyces xiangluensis]|uniref:Alpha/beta hydrolase n=1 Tax=Streptomyces xiangluensis TaxID=2665720 RepID=A0ABV8YYM6_9ACTN
MTTIVGVHGIAQQYRSEVALARVWRDELHGGLQLALREGRDTSTALDPAFALAFYGNVFRRTVKSTTSAELLDAADLTEPEQDFLLQLWAETAAVDPAVPPPAPSYKTMGLARTAAAQRALLALSRSRFFGPRAGARLPSVLRQVSRYFDDLDIRLSAREAVEREVTEDTRVLVGHSLGSAVAYEALCANPQWNISTFITLGSPLGIPHVIFHRLWPEPGSQGLGQRPGSIRSWVNIADRRDPVALVKKLDGLFAGPPVHDVLVDNGPTEHDVKPYLSAVETGRAVLSALGDSEVGER